MKQLFLALLLVCSAPAFADEKPIIDRWFEALLKTDRAAISGLLHDDVVIDLKTIGITQTKQEYLDALDSWEDASEGLELSWEWEGVDATSATAEVCYKFPSNTLKNLEVFVVMEGQIFRLETEAVEETC